MIDDPETLLTYFIKSGGAADFALRYNEAMSAVNRWFCSESYRREIHEPDKLWHYYMSCGCADSKSRDSRNRVSA